MTQYYPIPHMRDFRLPKVDFPKFNGSHPKVWKEKAKKYFEMFNVPINLWAQYATTHFKALQNRRLFRGTPFLLMEASIATTSSQRSWLIQTDRGGCFVHLN